MLVRHILILIVGLASQSQQPSPCARSLADNAGDPATVELCAGDEASRLAAAAGPGSTERTRHLEAAAAHYRRAVRFTSEPATKAVALGLLADVFDAQHLDDPQRMDATLRELLQLRPDDLAPVFRLARLEEDRGLIEAAEQTLLDARHRQPDAVEPNRMLAQFYARRVTALRKQEVQAERQPVGPGERDENGVFRVGGPVAPPSRLDVPRYPPDAQAAGIKGAVVAEVLIDPSGAVTDAKVVQSVPLLDEAALQAVRNWRFAPTLVNGQPVPVRMNVTVNFSLPPSPPSRP